MGILDQQVAVVTGAGRGLGKAIALRFAAEGADVVCLSRSSENAESAAEAVRESGQQAWAIAADVGDSDSVNQAVKQILSEAGKVDVLVNNAGVTRDGLLMRMSEQDWDLVLDTNLKGAFLLTKAFTRPMMKQRKGRIINISSVIGLIGNAGQVNYAASKAGLIGMTKSVARELASRNITTNVIAPGFIRSDMTAQLKEEQQEAILAGIPLGEMGEPEDIARAALFLAGPGARYITGQVLTVDGGMVM
ncbi:MAG: 3-oxoacyl-[acyl-carrier-protein] reductase [Verrucomicrobia bacterium]|nr:3-oxoacyl-[acyl-carrier-protein] reductase [Verrucomicrobiota bacterium]